MPSWEATAKLDGISAISSLPDLAGSAVGDGAGAGVGVGTGTGVGALLAGTETTGEGEAEPSSPPQLAKAMKQDSMIVIMMRRCARTTTESRLVIS